MKRSVLYLSLLVLLSCDSRQKTIYYGFPEKYEKKYQIYVDMKDYSPLLKDEKGNYIIDFDTTVIYTSTRYKDIANVKSYFRIIGRTQYHTDDELENKFGLKVIENIVGKNYTTPDGYMIPDHFEISLIEKN